MPNPLPQGFAPRSLLDSRTIVAAGRLVMEKQFTKLVEAFADVADQLPGWRLRILGQGHQRPHLVRETRKRGLWDRVELPGSTTDMASEWARASICALTSRAEGFPLGLQEAMAAGVPCVTFDCASGPREIVRHEVNGLLVAPESIAGMSAALLRLGTDDDLRHRLGAGALDSAAEWDADADRRPLGGDLRGRDRAPGRPAAVRRPVGRRPRRSRPPTPVVRRRRGHARRGPARRARRWRSRPPGPRPTSGWWSRRTRPATPVVVLPMAARHRFLQELAAAEVPSYLSLRDPAANGWHERRAPVAVLASDLLRGRTSMVAIEPWPTRPARTAATPRCSARAARSRWSSGRRASTGSWWRRPATATPSGSPAAPATVTTSVDGRRRPDAAADGRADRARVHVPGRRRLHLGGRPRPGVEPGPPRPAGRRCPGTATTRESSGQARFVSRDELRYSLRSIHLFAPWVRRIHLVTAGQVPEWLDPSHPQVAVVDHSRDPAGRRAADVQLARDRVGAAPVARPCRALRLPQRRLLPRPAARPGGVLQPGRAGRGVVLPQHRSASTRRPTRRRTSRRPGTTAGCSRTPSAPW